MAVIPGSGPHIVKHLQGRVESLKGKLDLAQQRIDDLERALGIGDDVTPLARFGLTRQEAQIVSVLMKLPSANRAALLLRIYQDEPERRFDVTENSVDVPLCRAKAKLRKLGVNIESAGYGVGWMIRPAGKARLARLIASNARMEIGISGDMRLAANRAIAKSRLDSANLPQL